MRRRTALPPYHYHQRSYLHSRDGSGTNRESSKTPRRDTVPEASITGAQRRAYVAYVEDADESDEQGWLPKTEGKIDAQGDGQRQSPGREAGEEESDRLGEMGNMEEDSDWATGGGHMSEVSASAQDGSHDSEENARPRRKTRKPPARNSRGLSARPPPPIIRTGAVPEAESPDDYLDWNRAPIGMAGIITPGRDEIFSEREDLVKQREIFMKEREYLIREREVMLKEREDLLRERARGLNEPVQDQAGVRRRENMVKERENFMREREYLMKEREAMLTEREGLLAERARIARGPAQVRYEPGDQESGYYVRPRVLMGKGSESRRGVISHVQPTGPQMVKRSGSRQQHETSAFTPFSRNNSPRRPTIRQPSGPVVRKEYDDQSSNANSRMPGCFSSYTILERIERFNLSISEKLKNNAYMSEELPQVLNRRKPPDETGAWYQPETDLGNIGSTSLRAIHAMEFSIDESGKGNIKIICPEGRRKIEKDSSLVQAQWLHVQMSTLSIDILQEIILSCPYVHTDLMSVAIILLNNIKQRFMQNSDRGQHINIDSVLRCVGEHPESPSVKESRDTSAIFLTSPYITLRPTTGSDMTSGDYESGRGSCQTLLQTFYGFDVDDRREDVQVLRKMLGNSLRKDSFHVSQLWCFLLGSKVLITCSTQSEQEVRGNSITISSPSPGSREPITITLIDDNKCRRAVVIERDYNYVDFLRHAVGIVKGNIGYAAEYELVGLDDETLTPTRWLEILRSHKSELYGFRLQTQSERQSRKQRKLLEFPSSNQQTMGDEASDALVLYQNIRQNGKSASLHKARLDKHKELTSAPQQHLASGSLQNEVADEGMSNAGTDNKDSAKGKSITKKFNLGEITESDGINLESAADNMALIVSGATGKSENLDPSEVELSKNAVGSRQIINTEEYLRQNTDIIATDMALPKRGPEVFDFSTELVPYLATFDNSDIDSDVGDTSMDGESPIAQEPHKLVHQPKPESLPPQTVPQRSTVHFEDSEDQQNEHHEIDGKDAIDIQPTPPELLGQPPSIVPFFVWQVAKNADPRITGFGEEEKSAVKILSQLNKALSVDGVGRLYVKLPKYWMSDVIIRHGFKIETSADGGTRKVYDNSITGTVSLSGSSKLNKENVDEMVQASNDTRRPGSSDRGESTGQRLKSNNQISAGGNAYCDHEPTDSTGSRKKDIFSGKRRLMIEMLEISQDILWSFAPNRGSSPIHDCCRRFWGCLDIIFRQMTWDDDDGESCEKKQSYIIRDFDESFKGTSHLSMSPLGQKKPWSSCGDCTRGTDYGSVTDALDHIHKEHIHCSSKTRRPYEDLCFVWIHRPWDISIQRSGSAVLQAAEEFVAIIRSISNLVNELHFLVARDPDNQPGKEAPAALPPLPRSLVDAFQKIVLMFIFKSQVLTLQNRHSSLSHTEDNASKVQQAQIRRKIDRFGVLEKSAREKAVWFLGEAKKDIILLGNTSQNINNLEIQAVGPELLVLALISSSQNRPLQLQTSGSTAQESSAIKLYQDYLSRLHFRANRRPERRVFLDIHDFEEELDAFAKVVLAQRELLGKYHSLICPNSFKMTSTTRISQHYVERSFAVNQQDQIDQIWQDIKVLKTKTRTLKEQVKQTIEIIEEDHGKAIRVFTIVTLFFLPLSFVSSFMGMNTTDIRNSNFSQGIFWMTGIPVTVVVVVLALAYGYRGDEIGDLLAQMITNWQGTRGLRFRHQTGGSEADEVSENKYRGAGTFNTVGSGFSDRRMADEEQTTRYEGMKILESFRRKRKQGKKVVASWFGDAGDILPS